MTQLNLTLEPEFLKALFLHDNGDAVKKLVERVIDAVLNAEAEEQVGAALYERTGEARTYRNGYRERSITTRVGTLELHIPKLRNGHFSTELFARYQCNERALMLSLMEMVIQGVSTRKVSAITEKLCGTQFSAQTVSQLCKELDESINVFRNRPLTKAYPFLCADATYVRQHSEDRGVISVGLFIVLGVREDGIREVLGFSVSEKESEATWKEMFQSLKNRGLQGVRLITSDAHCGIQKAIFQSFPGCAWQRCQTHFSRNVLDACPSRTVPELKIRLRDMYEAPTLDECRNRRDAILKDFSLSAPKAMKVLEQGWNDIVSVYAYPPTLRKKLRTSNAIERVNGEIKRRENVIRIFPNEASILRLMGAILMDLHENWAQRKYMDLTELCHWEAEQVVAPMGAMGEGTTSAA
ncbi:IS256 family transposase [Levyella massiliensis]|uniref:IS256 family transposase n=1 Tax=Levyella massiliensis TaxID=938289 RepID=UPI0023F2CFC1|nr:IS256 family transposase [Levyella massiliensis]